MIWCWHKFSRWETKNEFTVHPRPSAMTLLAATEIGKTLPDQSDKVIGKAWEQHRTCAKCGKLRVRIESIGVSV